MTTSPILALHDLAQTHLEIWRDAGVRLAQWQHEMCVHEIPAIADASEGPRLALNRVVAPVFQDLGSRLPIDSYGDLQHELRRAALVENFRFQGRAGAMAYGILGAFPGEGRLATLEALRQVHDTSKVATAALIETGIPRLVAELNSADEVAFRAAIPVGSWQSAAMRAYLAARDRARSAFERALQLHLLDEGFRTKFGVAAVGCLALVVGALMVNRESA